VALGSETRARTCGRGKPHISLSSGAKRWNT
jgi:hypothetical protein